MRRELEQAYEREKSKSVISKRCSRIYEQHLKQLEPNLLKHLQENEVVPELHLTRWLRCVMSREYCIESTLLVWDFIFSGVMLSKIDLNNPFENEEDRMFRKPNADPFVNLEFLSCSMISQLKEELMESDFSMCLGMLMSYKEPPQMSTTINKAVEIREAILSGKKYNREPSPSPSAVSDDHHEQEKQAVNYSMQPQLNIENTHSITTSSSLN